MRRIGILVLLAACHAPPASGPAWPAPSTTADDGGESLDPRTTTVAAAVEKSDDEDDQPTKAVAESKSETATVPSEDKPSVGAPSNPAPDDILMTDDLIIEIDD